LGLEIGGFDRSPPGIAVLALPRLYETLARSWKAADHPGASLVVMRKALTLILGCALFGIFAAVVVASQGADDPANHDTTTTGTVEQRTTTTEDNPARDRRDDDAKQNEDVSGPCDEAEHANDPRCTGQPTAPQGDDGAANDDRVDNSGPGSQNSGPGSVNSGRDDRGEAEVGDDRGGHGEVEAGDDRGGEVEAGDDRGGHGEVESGDDRGDNSGSGGGGGHSGRG
jgi:hypothetical protein